VRRPVGRVRGGPLIISVLLPIFTVLICKECFDPQSKNAPDHCKHRQFISRFTLAFLLPLNFTGNSGERLAKIKLFAPGA
jgi:hypothetical protein